MGRTPCCTKVGLNRGPWTPEEDVRLVNYIKIHGEGGWRTLPKKAGLLRCGKSCRLRWMNYLRPDVKRGHILPEEEDLILRLHRLLGNRWSLIAGRMPGRTDNEIKNYWNTHLSKKLINQGIDPRTHKPLSESEDIWWTPGDNEATANPPQHKDNKCSEESENANPVDKKLQLLSENEDEQLLLHQNDNVNERNMNEIPAPTSENIMNNFPGMPQRDSGHQISSTTPCVENLGHQCSHQKLMQLSDCDITSTVRNSGVQITPSFLSYTSRNAALEMALRFADTMHPSSVGEAVWNKKSNNNYGAFDHLIPSNFSICTSGTPLGALGYGDANIDTLSWFLEPFMNEGLNVSEPCALEEDGAHHNKQFGSNQQTPQNSSYELWYSSAQ